MVLFCLMNGTIPLRSYSARKLFTKSIPGVTFLIGLALLFPWKVFQIYKISISNIASVLLFILLLGLLLNEGINDICDIIQIWMFILWRFLVRSISHMIVLIPIKKIPRGEYLIDSISPNRSIHSGKSNPLLYRIHRRANIFLYILFAPTSMIFARHIYTGYGPYGDLPGLNQEEVIHELLVEKISEEYDVDIIKSLYEDRGTLFKLYPLIRGALAREDSLIAHKYHDSFMFYRNMWVLIMVFSVLILIINPYGVPMANIQQIAHFISGKIQLYIRYLLLLSFISCVYFSYKYKKEYVNQLVADYISIKNIDTQG